MAAPDIIDGATVLDPQWWRRAAQSAIRRHCGWHVAPSHTETLRIDAYGGRTLHLPTKHVTDIETLTIDGRDVLSRCDWSQAGTMQLRNGYWPDRPGAVDVTFTHGWDIDDVPEVAALILAIGKRARDQGRRGTVARQAANGASVDYLTAGGAPLSVPLLQIEKDALEVYRVNWGPQ